MPARRLDPNETENIMRNAVENERRAIVAEVVGKMDDDGATINHETVAAKIEEAFPGFQYDPGLDDYTRDTADASEPDADDPETLRQRARNLEQSAATLRADLYKLTNDRQAARGALAQAIADFTHGVGPKLSHADLVRQHIAASQAEKQARADGLGSAPDEVIPGKSYLDRQQSWRGDSETFARKQHKTGHSRGAYPASMRGARLPSQR
jgi:hypothetical protein